MVRYDLYIGHNVSGVPTHGASHVIAAVKTILAKHGFTGATFTGAIGAWDGALEDTTIVTVIAAGHECVRREISAVGTEIARALAQDCVMLLSSPVTQEFCS